MTIYKTNLNGEYALYSDDDGKKWKESASIHNDNPLVGSDTRMLEARTDTPANDHMDKLIQLVTQNKYNRVIYGLDGVATVVDVYRVLDAFPTENPQLQHLAKKALCAGLRGHKNTRQDLLDIEASIQSAIIMYDQKNK
jgi:hypothetical protein